jgi:hypothetical protein
VWRNLVQPRYHARCGIRTAVTVKIAIFWDMTPCNQKAVYRRSGGTCCLYFQGQRIKPNKQTRKQQAMQTSFTTMIRFIQRYNDISYIPDATGTLPWPMDSTLEFSKPQTQWLHCYKPYLKLEVVNKYVETILHNLLLALSLC